MKGALSFIASTFGFWLALWLFLMGLSYIFVPRDDTDPPDGRSGLSLHTDHLTGCQYVGKGFGNITPRLDADGQPICGKKQ